MKQETGNWKPYDVKRITNNIELVLKNQDIAKLNKQTYEFITLHMGFIAHFNLQGFQSSYSDLRLLCRKLQTAEYSDDKDYNLKTAERYRIDSDFKKWYGPDYNSSITDIIINIVGLVRKYEPIIDVNFDNIQKKEELKLASSLAEKHGYKLVRKE